jgi:WS/DGAT/MGAT family acyltransferase
MLSAAPLDRSRPLWEFTLVLGLEGGRAALLQKVHHTITDGVGGLKLSLSLVDLERRPADAAGLTDDIRRDEERRRVDEERRDPITRSSPLGVVKDAVGHAVATNAALVRRGAELGVEAVVHPTSIARDARAVGDLLGSLRRQVLVTDQSHSELFRNRSLGRRFDVLTVPLEDSKRAAAALGGTVNDLYVTAVAGGLGRYHERMGAIVDELRMAMPVSTRSDATDTAANRFAPTRVLVPTAPKDPTERFTATHARLHGVRHEPALAAAETLTALLAGLPTSLLVAATRAQTRTIDFAASNLRGSPFPLYIGGARIEASYPMGPRTGTPLNVTLLSYCGDLCLGINSDPAAVTDPDALVDALHESFDTILAAGA